MEKATGRRVLVVDDDPDTTNSFVDVLTLLGHEARGAYDGPNALILVAQFDPEIVLLDIAMPGMDGYELAEHIRDQQVHKPVVIVAVSGWGRKADVDRSLAVGFYDHLVKPVHEHLLVKVLARCEDHLSSLV